MARTPTLSLLAALLSFAGVARGQQVSDALALEAEGRLGEALDAYEAALQRPGNSREDLATIYLHLGVLRLATGEQAAARLAMHRLLAVEPAPTLPGSAPPEAQSLLEEVSSVWAGRRLGCEVSAPERVGPGEDLRVEIRVVDDVAGLVARAAVLSGSDLVAEAEGRNPFVATVPASRMESGSQRLSARLLDRYGGTVWEGSDFDVEVAATTDDGVVAGSASSPEGPGPGGEGDPRRALRIAGWTLVAAGVVAAAGGGALVGVDGVETGQTRVEDGQVQEEYLTTGTAGWVVLAAGAAAIVAGIVLLVVRPGSGGSAETALHLSRGVVASW